jgi:hypothetical protein
MITYMYVEPCVYVACSASGARVLYMLEHLWRRLAPVSCRVKQGQTGGGRTADPQTREPPEVKKVEHCTHIPMDVEICCLVLDLDSRFSFECSALVKHLEQQGKYVSTFLLNSVVEINAEPRLQKICAGSLGQTSRNLVPWVWERMTESRREYLQFCCAEMDLADEGQIRAAETALLMLQIFSPLTVPSCIGVDPVDYRCAFAAPCTSWDCTLGGYVVADADHLVSAVERKMERFFCSGIEREYPDSMCLVVCGAAPNVPLFDEVVERVYAASAPITELVCGLTQHAGPDHLYTVAYMFR